MSEYCKSCEQLKKENEYLKEWRRHSATCQECYEDGYQDGLRNNKKLIEYKQALEEIEEIVNVTHFQTLPLHRGSTHYLADKYDETRDKILEIIEKAKGEEK